MNYQAIIVLAGGSQKDNNIESLPEYVKIRLDRCAEIYMENKKLKIIVSSAGTPHRTPFINKYGYHIYECDSMAKYLVDKWKISEGSIYREYISYDTIGNAFFTKFNFIDPMKIKSFYLITSGFHFKRTKFIFDFIYNQDIKQHINKDNTYNINYIETKNGNVDKTDLLSRLNKEEKSLEMFKENIKRYKLNNFNNLYYWIYNKHNAYSTKGMIENKYNFSNEKHTLY